MNERSFIVKSGLENPSYLSLPPRNPVLRVSRTLIPPHGAPAAGCRTRPPGAATLASRVSPRLTSRLRIEYCFRSVVGHNRRRSRRWLESGERIRSRLPDELEDGDRNA